MHLIEKNFQLSILTWLKIQIVIKTKFTSSDKIWVYPPLNVPLMLYHNGIAQSQMVIVEFKTSKIGRAYTTDSLLTYFERRHREDNLDISNSVYEPGKGNGTIFCDQVGSCKTQKLCEMVHECEQVDTSNHRFDQSQSCLRLALL